MREETLRPDQYEPAMDPDPSRSPDGPAIPDGDVDVEPAAAAEPVTAAVPSAAATAPVAEVTEPEVTGPAAPELVTVWPAETARGFRDRWREIQLRFVDDPRVATSDAEALLAEALAVLSESLAAHKAEIDTWGDAGGADIERLRTGVRRYRDLLERLLVM